MAADEMEVFTILSNRKSRERRFRWIVAPSASNFTPIKKEASSYQKICITEEENHKGLVEK